MKFSMSLFAAAAVFTFSASANPALAQQFPAKPVTLITPFPPGSGPDALLRLVGDRLSRSWGQ
jgi:tripartite-type tricarboxylate transporter receptor subunit TctC